MVFTTAVRTTTVVVTAIDGTIYVVSTTVDATIVVVSTNTHDGAESGTYFFTYRFVLRDGT